MSDMLPMRNNNYTYISWTLITIIIKVEYHLEINEADAEKRNQINLTKRYCTKLHIRNGYFPKK